MYRFSLLPRRFGKRILRETLTFVLARPQMLKLTKGLFAYFPVLRANLKAKVFAFAGIRETNLRQRPEDTQEKESTGTSPFFYYNSTFDPQILIRKHAPNSIKPHKKYVTNYLGLLIDPKIFPSHLNKEIGKVENIPIPANWHADIAEWGAALRAVEFSKGDFTIIEVGCGWGCWMNNTGLVAKRQGLNLNLIGIEGDQGHIDFAKETLNLNGFQASEYKIYRGIAAAHNGYAFFPNNENSGEAYGQEPVFCNIQQDIKKMRKSGKYDELPMISLEDISRECTRIDLLHIDIQGGEVDFIRDCLDILSKKVAYILIGTHSREIEGHLFEILLKAGWLLEIERPAILSLDPTPRVTVDGVQAWRNRKLLP
jgi:FkbM family methyltransferase